MSPDETPPSPYSFSSAPPTQAPSPILAVPPPNWPTVIGVIAIVWAAIGILGSVCGFVISAFMPAFNQIAPDAPPTFEMTPLTAIMYVLGLAMAAVLMAVGVGLMKRRPWSVRLGRFWAVANIVVVLFSVLVAYGNQKSQMEAMSDGGPPMPTGFMEGVAIGSVSCGLIFGWALPVFLLVWFARQKIKDHVAAWPVSHPTP